MAYTTTAIPKEAEDLRSWLLSGCADGGEVRVADATVAWDEDAEGEPILRFSVVLANPAEETWPVDEVLAFHRRVDEKASEVGLAAPRYVGIQAETPEEFDLS